MEYRLSATELARKVGEVLERLRQRAAAATDDDEKRRLLREAREVQLRIDVMLDLSRRRG